MTRAISFTTFTSMANRRFRYIATLIVGYFTHGLIVQMSDRSRQFATNTESSKRANEETILQSLENTHLSVLSRSSTTGSFENSHPSTDKTSGQDNSEIRRAYSTENPYEHSRLRPPRKQSDKNEPVPMESLRYAAFGTSRTWGSGLDEPSTQAYVKLLSPNGINYGLRATGADYPSICLHSMIGDDEVFDVIILEFTPAGGVYLTDFTRLAKRVRARFPDAIIIYLPIFWILHEVLYKDESIFKHLFSLAITSQDDPAFERFINSLPDSDLRQLDRREYHHIDSYRETLKSINGHMIEFPALEGEDLRKHVLENAKYIGNPSFPLDDNHPSLLGHQRIAQLIQQLLGRLPLPVPSNAQVGEWLGGKDSCISWFSNGKAGQDNDLEVTSMNLNPFAHESKWAWEVAQEGGTISVNCRDPPCDVYLGHMASTHIENYPRAQLKMRNETTIVSPLVFADSPQMVNVISRVGTLTTAGKTTISITPFPERAANPFRVTGLLLAPVVQIS